MNTSIFSSVFRVTAMVLCLAFGFFGTLALIPKNETIVMPQAPIPDEVSDTVTALPFTLAPPSLSLRAQLTTATGDVRHKTRDAGAFVSATPSATIVLGESIATGVDGKATITIPSLVTIGMEKNAELVFANMFLENSVLQQKAGEIMYHVESVDHPVAIRALRALVSARNSVISISIDDANVAISVQKGEAKVGIVDSENTTHVYTVTEGNRATIDTYSQTIRIVSPR
jgi:hypothetical protein